LETGLESESRDCTHGRPQGDAPEPASRFKVAFATHAWERDFDVVLDPHRFEMVVASCCVDFDRIIVVLNNFKENDEKQKARHLADRLMESGSATDVIDTQEYLRDDILQDLGLTPDRFWENNPFFASSQLAALHFARKHADYLLHFCGDVWLENKGMFIDRAIRELRSNELVGMNLCRNIYLDQYPQWAEGENHHLWFSKGVTRSEQHGGSTVRKGFGLSDLAYLLSLDVNYKFTDFSTRDYSDFLLHWPSYASPCFEMYFSRFLSDLQGEFTYATLKPIDRVPITKHKNFPYNKLRKFIYKMTGRWNWNGKYGTNR
jgi:hypothetical protein